LLLSFTAEGTFQQIASLADACHFTPLFPLGEISGNV